MKIKYLLLISLIVATSCSNQRTTLFYYNGTTNNGKCVLGSDLKYFFLEDNDIARTLIENKRFNDEISKIKEEIITKNNIVIPDDSYYVFAFITKKDTLFADNRLEFWRYKDKGISYKLDDSSKNIILKHYKLNPNQRRKLLVCD
ncbi:MULTISPECIES: hypothetical protein [Chryseobacterium]|uniref:Lipoprotein n=1 Tax=Chryseobacterium taihuense TaxID=1141221 RepID=A0A4U8WLP2_9FLAO|nr:MULTISPECIES: hypothetical protein [Chryseobacterium]QQV02979.1 hypothetical protein I6I61_01045 [Chryseobacterium sp. FDAARGOS 1104]VFB03738.1 Uncharacterised protein [Chryseobacterium taihuense]